MGTEKKVGEKLVEMGVSGAPTGGLSELAGPGKRGKPKRTRDPWRRCMWLPAREDGPRRGAILPLIAEQHSGPACDRVTVPKSWSLNLDPAPVA